MQFILKMNFKIHYYCHLFKINSKKTDRLVKIINKFIVGGIVGQ